MRITIILLVALFAIILLSGCQPEQKSSAQVTTNQTTTSTTNDVSPAPTPEERYLRIDLDGESMGDELLHQLKEDTAVTFELDENTPLQIPIYEIKPHTISEDDFSKALENLDISYNPHGIYSGDWLIPTDTLDSNCFYCKNNSKYREAYDNLQWTDEELEANAREIFNKISFLEGEYRYVGITDTVYEWTLDTGEIVESVGVSFLRLVDGMPVTSSDQCIIRFDGSGFVELVIRMYDYKEIGTMDLVPLADAQARIKTPDAFTIENTPSKIANTLEVEGLAIFLVNQYTRGCTILQPVYNFSGTVTLEDGTESRFKSQVIAIPESYTYEEAE